MILKKKKNTEILNDVQMESMLSSLPCLVSLHFKYVPLLDVCVHCSVDPIIRFVFYFMPYYDYRHFVFNIKIINLLCLFLFYYFGFVKKLNHVDQ